MARKITRPNILFIMADQLRFDATGLNGGWVDTPHLDRIAREGVNYTRCYANSPICMPTRISLATGLYPHNTNVWSNIRYTLPKTVQTWTQVIKELGYRTAVFGKTHLYSHHAADMRDHADILQACGFDEIDEIPGPRACVRMLSNLTDRWQKKGLWDAYKEDYRDRFATKPHLVRPSVLPLEEYADVYVAEKTRQYLQYYDRPEPWFCWLSFGGPHEPWDTPEPYASRYDPEQMPEPIMPEEEGHSRPLGNLDRLLAGESPGQHDTHSAEATLIDEEEEKLRAQAAETNRPSPGFEPGDIAGMRASYAGNVTLIDDQVGKVLKTVEERGELGNTIIVFTSDHGEMNGDYGLIYKRNFLDSAVRVPLIIMTPSTAASTAGGIDGSVVTGGSTGGDRSGGGNGGRTCHGIAEWFDIGPTLVDLAGGRLAYRQFARSLVGTIEDSSASHRQDALSEIDGEHMIVDGRWKLAINTDGRAYILFDLKEDPLEKRNLAGRTEYRQTEERLRLRILERIAASHIDG